MLPPTARLRHREDFAAVLRRGRRASRGGVVVHLLVDPTGPASAQVGFVVGRRVGGAVQRNLVSRRLRHLMRDRLPTLPSYARLVVRALPGSVQRDFTVLGQDVDAALARLRPVSV